MPQFLVTLMTECPVSWRVKVEAPDAEAAAKFAKANPYECGDMLTGDTGETRLIENDWTDLDARDYYGDGGLQVERVTCARTQVDLSAAAGITADPETCADLVAKLSRMTDPRDSEDGSEELEAFAAMIRRAKEIMGDNAPEL